MNESSKFVGKIQDRCSMKTVPKEGEKNKLTDRTLQLF